jgi:hypothetical protein
MNFPFDDFNNFSVQHASHSCRVLVAINYPQIFHSHGPCSYCSNPYHSSSNFSSWGQRSNFLDEQMNINFSCLRFELDSNFYNQDWSNHSDFSWQAQAMENYAPQCHDQYHLEYLQFDSQSSHHSSYNQLIPQSTLEGTLKTFMQLTGEAISDMKNATMVNTRQLPSWKDRSIIWLLNSTE